MRCTLGCWVCELPAGPVARWRCVLFALVEHLDIRAMSNATSPVVSHVSGMQAARVARRA
jgi:hypothetical protein